MSDLSVSSLSTTEQQKYVNSIGLSLEPEFKTFVEKYLVELASHYFARYSFIQYW